MRKLGIRVELDDRNEKLGYRIREAQTSKIPVEIVVGDGEKESNGVTVRRYGSRQEVKKSMDDFLKDIQEEIHSKKM